jgi:peptide/nickel transport system substrate-binding protein
MQLSKLSITAVALAAALTLSSCASPSGEETASTATPQEGGVINIAWASQPPTLDPGAVTTTSTNFVAYNVFEGLLALDENMNVQPVLASSWEQENYQKFTFELRTDVTFHNGEPMTADDVVASITRWMQDSTTGKAAFGGATITATDEDTVVLETAAPMYTAAAQLAQPTQQAVIMPASSIAQKVASGIPTEHLIGTGPFSIGTVEQDKKIELDRFEDYVPPSGESSGLAGEKKAYADTLIFNIVPDQTTRLNGLDSGQYDFASDLSPDNVEQIKANPALQLQTLNSGILSLVLNKTAGPFSDPELRQAIQAGLDSEAIMTATYATTDLYDLNGALAPRGQDTWFTEAGLENYNQADLDKAAELIEDSAYNGEPIKLITTRDYPYMYNSAVVIADQMTEMGLTVDLQVTDWASLLKAIANPDTFDATSVDFLLRPSPLALSFFNPSYAGWTNDPAITEAINAINASTSDEEASEHVEALQEAFFEYVPVIKFGEIRSITAQRTDVGGFTPFIGPIFFGAYHVAE